MKVPDVALDCDFFLDGLDNKYESISNSLVKKICESFTQFVKKLVSDGLLKIQQTIMKNYIKLHATYVSI